ATDIAPNSTADAHASATAVNSGGAVDRPAALGEAATGAARAHGQHLGENRDRGVGRRVRAEVEARRAREAVEALFREARLEEPLATLRLRLTRADCADVERLAGERRREGGHVEPLLVREHDHRGVAVQLEL